LGEAGVAVGCRDGIVVLQRGKRVACPMSLCDLWHINLHLDMYLEVYRGIPGCAELGRAWYGLLFQKGERVCM
jgi:hypothetical protein